jgi:hypothetical protein
MVQHARTRDEVHEEAPCCPPWCQEHADGDTWEVHPGSVTKTCRRVIECDGGAEVEVERFASIEDNQLLIEWATVQARCGDDPLDTIAALTLAETIIRAVEMIEAPHRAIA